MSSANSGKNNYLRWSIVGLLLILTALLLGFYWWRALLTAWLWELREFWNNRDQVRTWLLSFGMAAPLVFIVIQTLQVILAPIPGEATGFLGGFLFGWLLGFVYSTVGLTLGSLVAFLIGRWLELKVVEKVIRPETLARFQFIMERQGTLVAFLLFLLPGFPKDYLCLILGLSRMPLKVFLLIASIGRMPGTLMLSLQGAKVYDGEYLMVAVLLLLCGVAAVLGYFYRERLYLWLHRLSGQPAGSRKP